MSTAEFQKPFGTRHLVEPLRANWGWIVALGVIYVIGGIIALESVVTATVASVFVVGIIMLVAGIAEVVHAFRIKSWGGFLLWFVLGGLYIVAGVVTFTNPALAAAVLTFALGFLLIASGITRLILAFSVQTGMAWIILSGLISLFLGGVILAHWPFSSLYVLGLFLGIDLIFIGVSRIALGLGLRRVRI
jgi:uncharacterized membrane protein HdeD (DUF308 family)